MSDLPIIQKTYDLIKWYVPILNRLPRSHKFALGDRVIAELYNSFRRINQGALFSRQAKSAQITEHPARHFTTSNSVASRL